MARLTDTQVVRTYLENNQGGILDISYDSEHVFSNIPSSNLRKYIARFVSEGTLRKISKGIYSIGGNPAEDRSRIISHYIESGHGIPCGKTLLKSLGFINENDGAETYLTNKTIGNKTIEDLNIQLIATTSFFMPNDVKAINTAIDLISNKHLIDEEKIIEFNELIISLLKDYDDFKLQRSIELRYSRLTYIALANYLKLMGISNQVMDIYETKVGVHSNKQ